MPDLNVYLAQISPTTGDLAGNHVKIIDEFKKASQEGCDLVVFPEMAICGYNCQDLLLKPYFLSAIEKEIISICESTKGSHCAILFGSPISEINRAKKTIIHNSALLLDNGKVTEVMHKKSLPNHGVFDEQRHFTAGQFLSFIEFRGLTLAILICEDLWNLKNIFLMQEQVWDAAIAINASPYSYTKYDARLKIAENFTKTLERPLIYVNQTGAQDSLVFDGSSFVLDENGKTICQLAEFQDDSAIVNISKEKNNNSRCSLITGGKKEISTNSSRDYSACVLGLRDYVLKSGFKKILLGMSGGIDSALVATMAVDALGSENVSLYALPSQYNSQTSMSDAIACAQNLQVDLKVISIEKSFTAMKESLKEIGQDTAGLTEENMQSRIRGNLLMALSNQSGALLLSTGNKSELAVGYATIYGDMCGSFNPIKDLYKTQVYQLSKWRNTHIPAISLHQHLAIIPDNIITKEPTAELRPNQKDSDSLPNYDILDRILFALIEEQKSEEDIITLGLSLGFDKSIVKQVVKLFYNSEYKRQQSCLGPKISDMSFDKDRRYPITNKFTT